jgi:hypothetical protein
MIMISACCVLGEDGDKDGKWQWQWQAASTGLSSKMRYLIQIAQKAASSEQTSSVHVHKLLDFASCIGLLPIVGAKSYLSKKHKGNSKSMRSQGKRAQRFCTPRARDLK